jgi:hypothetical protein
MEGVDYTIEVQFNNPIHIEEHSAYEIARMLETLDDADKLSAEFGLRDLVASNVDVNNGVFNGLNVQQALELINNSISTPESFTDFVMFLDDVEHYLSLQSNIGDTVTFEERGSYFEPYVSFQWRLIKDGIITKINNRRTPSFLMTAEGSYDVSLTVINTDGEMVAYILKEDVLQVGLPSTTYSAVFHITNVYGSPLPNVAISITGDEGVIANGVTDTNGYYSYYVEPGNYSYSATKTGYDTITDTFTVVDQNVTIEETMELSTYNITFHVTDGASIPIDSATVVFNSNTVLTDVNGDALFEDVEYGTKTYTISKTGYSVVTGSVNVNSSKTVTVSLGVGVAYWGVSDTSPVTVSTTNSATVVDNVTYNSITVPYNNTTTNKYLWIASPVQLTRSSTLGYYESITDSFTESTTTISGVTFYLYVSSWKTKVETMIFDNYTS